MSPRKAVTTTESVPVVVEAEIDTAAFESAIAKTERAPSLPPCALESAHIGAKVVVSRNETEKVVRLLDSSGATELDRSDICYTLPAGAKIRKVSAMRYDAFRLGVQEGAILSAPSAREAVAEFLRVVA